MAIRLPDASGLHELTEVGVYYDSDASEDLYQSLRNTVGEESSHLGDTDDADDGSVMSDGSPWLPLYRRGRRSSAPEVIYVPSVDRGF